MKSIAFCRLEEAKYQMSRQGWHKAEQYLVSSADCYRMCPLLTPNKVCLHVVPHLY